MDAPLSPLLEVVTPGLLTTVQDLGRYEYAALGLTTSGAVDPFSLRVANALAGNNPADPALEIAVPGLELQALRGCTVALAGADFGARLDGETRLMPGRSYFLRSGARLSFTEARNGARAYLALAGAIAAPLVLGSASTYLTGAIGGLDGSGRALRSGDKLAPARLVEPLTVAGRVWPKDEHISLDMVRVIPGPHLGYFAPDALQKLCATPWKVSEKSDRMGLRLVSEPLSRSEAGQGELLSQGVVRGAIQVPPDGLPIVLLADHQTTGGYPVIGVVASADWPVLAQQPPGAALRFSLTTVAEAQAAYRAQEHNFAEQSVALWQQSQDVGVDWAQVAGWSGLGIRELALGLE